MEEIKQDDEITNLGSYYSYRGELYIKEFPIMWAKNHAEGTGPEECENCSFYGSWNGIFIGYCVNCAEYIYEFQRGHGFIEHGEEFDHDIPQLRAMDTYLYGVDLDEIEIIHNRDFYETSSYSDESHIERYLDNAKEYKKYKKSNELFIKKTPVADTSCDICSVGK